MFPRGEEGRGSTPSGCSRRDRSSACAHNVSHPNSIVQRENGLSWSPNEVADGFQAAGLRSKEAEATFPSTMH